MSSAINEGAFRAIAQLWRHAKTRSILIQIVALALLFGFLFFITTNAIQNLARLDKAFGFDFLWWNAGYDINQTLIQYSNQSTHFRAALVGVLNTLLVAGCGIIFATLLGFIMGIARLSKNWMVNRLVYCFLEFIRNIPLLIHILFIYGLAVNILPHPREALDLGGGILLTNRGAYLPKPIFEPGFSLVLLAFILGLALSWLIRRRAKLKQSETGQSRPVFWIISVLIIGLPLLAYLATGMPLTFEHPIQGTFNLKGGLALKPEFLALWLALSVYTATYIAEIVRAGIQSVAKGQAEAALALGLSPRQTMRLVILPQALRVIIPPLANQYLNLTKNSSLAIAIGYMDITATLGGITLNQTGRAIECMMLLLLIYLCLSLTISGFMNWYNRRKALVEK